MKDAEAALKHLHELAQGAQKDVEGARPGVTFRAEPDYEIADQGLKDLERALGMRELEGANEAVRRAQPSVERLSRYLDEDANTLDSPFVGKERPLVDDAHRRVAQAVPKVREIRDALSRLFPDPTLGDVEGGAAAAGRAGQAAGRAGAAGRASCSRPSRSWPARRRSSRPRRRASWASRRGHMGEAASELGNRNPQRGHGEQELALDALARFRKGLEDAAKGMRQGGGQQGQGFPFPFAENEGGEQAGEGMRPVAREGEDPRRRGAQGARGVPQGPARGHEAGDARALQGRRAALLRGAGQVSALAREPAPTRPPRAARRWPPRCALAAPAARAAAARLQGQGRPGRDAGPEPARPGGRADRARELLAPYEPFARSPRRSASPAACSASSSSATPRRSSSWRARARAAWAATCRWPAPPARSPATTPASRASTSWSPTRRARTRSWSPTCVDALEKQRAALGEGLGTVPKARITVEIVGDVRELAQLSTLTEDEVRTSGTVAVSQVRQADDAVAQGAAQGLRLARHRRPRVHPLRHHRAHAQPRARSGCRRGWPSGSRRPGAAKRRAGHALLGGAGPRRHRPEEPGHLRGDAPLAGQAPHPGARRAGLSPRCRWRSSGW